MPLSHRIHAFAVFTALAGQVFAQAQSSVAPSIDPAVIRVNVELVNLLCTVRNKSGAYVNDLSQSDFTVLEDGHPQPITHFARQTDSPLTLAVLLDVTYSARNVFGQEIDAARQFFHNVLRPGDRALLAGFAAGVTVWQDLTSSQQTLNAALDQVAPFQFSPPAQKIGPGPVLIMIRCVGGGRLYDAVDLVSSRKLNRQPGRKAIVLLSDGNECGSEVTQKQVVQAAQESDVVIYGVHYDGESGFGLQTLKDLSEPTGGRTFHVDKKTTVEAIFAAIEAEIRNQYAIGYAAPETARNGVFHKVEVRVAKPGLVVRSRNGYYR